MHRVLVTAAGILDTCRRALAAQPALAGPQRKEGQRRQHHYRHDMSVEFSICAARKHLITTGRARAYLRLRMCRPQWLQRGLKRRRRRRRRRRERISIDEMGRGEGGGGEVEGRVVGCGDSEGISSGLSSEVGSGE